MFFYVAFIVPLLTKLTKLRNRGFSESIYKGICQAPGKIKDFFRESKLDVSGKESSIKVAISPREHYWLSGPVMLLLGKMGGQRLVQVTGAIMQRPDVAQTKHGENGDRVGAIAGVTLVKAVAHDIERHHLAGVDIGEPV